MRSIWTARSKVRPDEDPVPTGQCGVLHRSWVCWAWASPPRRPTTSPPLFLGIQTTDFATQEEENSSILGLAGS